MDCRYLKLIIFFTVVRKSQTISAHVVYMLFSDKGDCNLFLVILGKCYKLCKHTF